MSGAAWTRRATRVLAAARGDVRLQWRNGFYLASAVVVVVSVALLRWLPERYAGWLLPVVLLENILVNTYYFLGGLVLLEKGEGTLEALVVTPLRAGEYVLSKVLTLTAVSLVESGLIAFLAYGGAVNVAALAAGIALPSVLFCLFGLVVVVRYDSINEYLLPSVVWSSLISLPLLEYFGVGPGPAWHAHPVTGPLRLLRAAFDAGGSGPNAGAVAYAVLYAALWCVPLFLWSERSLRRFVVAGPARVRRGARGAARP